MRKIVSDTGPILHLWEAQLLHLLPAAGSVLVPPAVRDELQGLAPIFDSKSAEWLQVAGLEASFSAEAANWQLAGLLDRGEAEALALARQTRASWLLTDDAAARWVAQSQDVEVHGSLGVLLWTAAAGVLDRDQAEQALLSLERSSLWISKRVRAEARAALEKLVN